MNINKVIIVLGAVMLATGCGNFMFSSNRSFTDEMERDSDGLWIANEDFPVIPGDTGGAYRSAEDIFERTPASATTREDMRVSKELMRDLAKKESVLSDRDYSDYLRVKGSFSNDSERIYYLGLSPAQRKDYLNARYIPTESVDMENLNFFRGRDNYRSTIALGMEKDRVLNIMGRPSRVDVAGDPRNQNERWAFNKNGQVRYVYFERGRVQGWSLE